MAEHARLKNEFTEGEKYHTLVAWLKCFQMTAAATAVAVMIVVMKNKVNDSLNHGINFRSEVEFFTDVCWSENLFLIKQSMSRDNFRILSSLLLFILTAELLLRIHWIYLFIFFLISF